MCRSHHHVHASAEKADLDMLPSFPRGAIGVGAVLSTMAIFMRRDVGDYLEAQEEVSPFKRLTYLILILAVLKHHNSLLLQLKEAVRRISLRVGRTLKRSTLSSQSLKKSLSSAEALCRLSRVSSAETIKKLSSTIRNTIRSYRRRAALKAITRKECFAKLDYIGKLSIQDLVIIFRYVNDVTQVDFHKKQFMKQQSQLLRSIVTAMDMAVTMSRGANSQSRMVTGERKKGEVDALYFAAAVRIFAEWRCIRLVPNGYNRYAMGLNLAYRDVLQNLAKIEDGVHCYFKYHEKKLGGNPTSCPTLRQLLEFESETNVHPKLPHLVEKSAASGLLWTKRQLHYQTSLFKNLFQVPQTFATTQDGVAAAYAEVYDLYHGWAAKQVFAQSFGGSPPLEAILQQMHPDGNTAANRDNCSLRRGLSDVSEGGESLDNEFLAALEQFGKQLTRKWDDFLRFFNCVDSDDEENSRPQSLIISSESYLDMTGFDPSHLATVDECLSDDSGICIDEDSPDPIDEAKIGSLEFVKELFPLLEDISGLIQELNMNDPSRV